MHSLRFLIGGLGIPAVLLLAFAGGWYWFFAVLMLHLAAVAELQRVSHRLGWQVPGFLLYGGGILFDTGSHLWGQEGYVLAGLTVFAVLAFHFLRVYPRLAVGELVAGFWFSIYLGLFSFLILLGRAYGWQGLFAALFITWASDTLAYYVGSLWGRHRLAPVISPNKTWEGALAGLLGATLVGMAAGYLLREPLSLWILAALLAAVAAQGGDLLESALKRQANLKDAGNILPGHGGILDRFDSLLFVGPIAYYLFGWFGLGS